MQTLMDINKEEQRKAIPELAMEMPDSSQKVAFQGIKGAYSEEAMNNYFGRDKIEGIAYPTFSSVLSAVRTGEADYGILPIENSTTGSVEGIYNLLIEHECFIVGEYILPINHCLLALPGAHISDINKVLSHEQGLSQCNSFLREHLEWQKQPYYNTAMSAAYIKEKNDKGLAAIASRYAADIYGLEVLSCDIQTEINNSTRFFIVSNQLLKRNNYNKLTFSFTVTHESGSLYRVLGIFTQKNWNMTHLESRPIPKRQWEYRFFVDIEGDFNSEDIAEIPKLLSKECHNYQLLGCYEGARDCE